MTRLALVIGMAVASAAWGRVPDIDDLIGIETVGEARISPDGDSVAYTVTAADFDEDAYLTHIWLADLTGNRFPLTRGASSARSPRWSPDGKWIAFVSSRHEDKNQIYVIRADGGEAARLTASKSGVADYDWSPDGTSIAYTASEPADDYLDSRKEHMGPFHVVRREYRHRHLWTIDVAEAIGEPTAGEQHTRGDELNLRDFSWSPDGSKIAFSGTVNPDLIQGGTADIYVLDLADDSVVTLVSQPGPDTSPAWSPDGGHIAFSTYVGREPYYALNNEIAVVPASGGDIRVLTGNFDEEPRVVEWKEEGIYFSALQSTASHLFRVDPASSSIARVTSPDGLMGSSFSLSAGVSAKRKLTFVAVTPTTLGEIQHSDLSTFSPKTLTDMTRQIDDLDLGSRELISWRSEDGTEIEGVLVKPPGFDPSAKHPLLCVIHGGPTGIDRPHFRGNRYYPVDIWASRGALILRVNYRGSAGYGEAFRTLNVKNLGVGDAWDVLSGIDHLIDRGWADSERVGCMGWSQGGYISAFLTASTDRFRAISVGAGISNWATYYYNTDITPFTIQYLGNDPVADPEIYRKTSPMSYIEKASTPTLIQHGEFDRRVPIPNAYELRQGLEDRGVPVEMVVYEGFGHGINKPRSQRAVMWHNLVWFNHHLWGDPLPPLDAPEVPESKERATTENEVR